MASLALTVGAGTEVEGAAADDVVALVRMGVGDEGGDEKFGMESVVGFSDSIPNVLDY